MIICGRYTQLVTKYGPVAVNCPRSSIMGLSTYRKGGSQVGVEADQLLEFRMSVNNHKH